MKERKNSVTGPKAEKQDDASPWSNLQSSYLESLAPSKKDHIFSTSTKVAKTLERWAEQYPNIRQVRILPLSLSVTSAAPFGDIKGLISTARMSLWVFTLDDLFDEENLPHHELMERASHYLAITQSQTNETSDDQLSVALCDIRDDIAAYPLFGGLKSRWTNALCGTINEMIREHQWGLDYRQNGVEMLPSYEEYLNCGRYSIGGPPHFWSAIITINDPLTVNHQEHLLSMEKIASTCIRLANDLQSYSKEITEDKINSLIILRHFYHQNGLSFTRAQRQAESHIRNDISSNLEELTRILSFPGTQTKQPELAIINMARFVSEFYTKYDYHTFSLGRK